MFFMALGLIFFVCVYINESNQLTGCENRERIAQAAAERQVKELTDKMQTISRKLISEEIRN